MSFLAGLGTVGGAILGSAIPGVGTALGATVGGGLGSMFGGSSSKSGGGGGSGGYGGGGGGMMNFQLPPPNQFAMDYMKNNFFDPSDIGFTDDPGSNTFANTLLTGIDNNKIDKYQAFNQLGASGVNMQDPALLNSKAYGDLLKDTIGRSAGRDIAGGYANIFYGDEKMSTKEQDEIYDFAASLGKTGSPQEFGNLAAALISQKPGALRNRPLSPKEQTLATRYGGAVFDDKGSMFFTPTTAQKRRGDRVNAFEDALYSA